MRIISVVLVDALLDLGEADSEGDVNTALTAINAEIDECFDHS